MKLKGRKTWVTFNLSRSSKRHWGIIGNLSKNECSVQKKNHLFGTEIETHLLFFV